MTNAPPRYPDDHAEQLLCEGCGYVLEGSRDRAACPECGKPVAESLPESRVGTPWQQRPSLSAWLLTAWQTVRHPARTFDRVRIDPDARWRDEGLRWDNLIAASFLGVLVLMLGHASSFGEAVLAFGVAVVFAPVVVLPLLALTDLERIGIGFIGQRRGWRIDAVVSRVVCAHASVGWIVATVLSALAYLVSWPVYHAVRRAFSANSRAGGPARPAAPSVWGEFIDWVPMALPFLGFAAGMLAFELLVWIGVRRCKYANRPMVRRPDRPG